MRQLGRNVWCSQARQHSAWRCQAVPLERLRGSFVHSFADETSSDKAASCALKAAFVSFPPRRRRGKMRKVGSGKSPESRVAVAFPMLSLSACRPLSLGSSYSVSALPRSCLCLLLFLVTVLLLCSSWTLTRLLPAQLSPQNLAAAPHEETAPENALDSPERPGRTYAPAGVSGELSSGAEAASEALRSANAREGSRELISRGDTELRLHPDRLRGRGGTFSPDRTAVRDARQDRGIPRGGGVGGLEQGGKKEQADRDVCGQSETHPCSVVFIADLDVGSRVDSAAEGGKPGELLFKSYALKGQLYRHPRGGRAEARRAEARSATAEGVESADFHFRFSPDEVDVLYGSHNVGGRGMELSELVMFNEELLTFDDRTGIVYRFHWREKRLVPKWLLVEGDGQSSDKGMKIEWATVKGQHLYVGSFGKEYTDNNGNILHRHNFWVAIIDGQGRIKRENWEGIYESMKKALGIQYPGYIIHEAINWSDKLNRWVVLPRRVSREPYDDVKDERRGSNKLLLCSEDFSNIDVVDIETPLPVDPRKGFSSFKFVPGTGDKVILAVKSLEDSTQNLQQSFLTIFDISGRVLLPDTPFPHASKYEGVAFV
ncbi:apyrase [Toxoplasma gondii TgCatPRC2]|uniref:Apyrase n=1 Tax=Toxoplasma gondii TgCatPRC2 TaxID=1130821 RepID=A0A151HL37_TOXGO|nr:apyrase [Toxoplasma gondii TgCatPRC2]